jgi:hypothetical protein
MMRILLFTFCAVLFFSSCKKAKIDNEMKHLQQFDPGSESPIRLINTAEYAQVMVNGQTLTNFISRRAPSPQEPYQLPFDPFWSSSYPGTPHFPVDGYLGREWRIPQQLFRETGRLDIFLYDGVGFAASSKLGITINKTNNKPTDYYLGGYDDANAPYFVVDRDETPPTRAGYFKIRVINLSYPLGGTVYSGNPAGPFRDLSGEVSLTYADGTSVSDKTNLVNLSKRVSEYIELPYGKYQFRILHHTGWQLPGTDGDMAEMTLDPPTASADLGFLEPNHVVYAPIHSYQPGGVYTILVHPSKFRDVERPLPFMVNQEFVNSFRVIEDNKILPNISFSRIQSFNAIPGVVLQVSLNGKKVATGLSFGNSSNYEIFESGEYQIEAKDEQGKTLSTVTYTLQPNQNYTAWAYPQKDGTAKILLVANDLSAENAVTDGGQDNGAYGRRVTFMPFAKKFLNLCPDIPYLTFTKNNGQPIGNKQSSNLQPGVPVLTNPYVGDDSSQKAFELVAYRSAPGLVPGTWADDIPVLHNIDFISRQALYTQTGGKLPIQEPGFYTVALIGRTGADVPAAYKAKMVILKHNK